MLPTISFGVTVMNVNHQDVVIRTRKLTITQVHATCDNVEVPSGYSVVINMYISIILLSSGKN